MTLQQALQYLISGGSVALAAAFCSWLAENVPAYQALVPGAKQAVMVAVCLVLSLGAWAVQTYVPPAVLAQLAAPFGIAAATVAALLVNQAWHALVNKPLTTSATPGVPFGAVPSVPLTPPNVKP